MPGIPAEYREEFLWDRAEQVLGRLHDHWPAVRALAAKLIVRRTLTGAEVSAILESNACPAGDTATAF